MSNWFCISMLLRQRGLENWSLPSWWAVPFRCLPSNFVYALPQFYFVVVSLVLDLKITLPFPLQTLHRFCLAGSCPCHIMQVHAFLCYKCCLRISYPAAPTVNLYYIFLLCVCGCIYVYLWRSDSNLNYIYLWPYLNLNYFFAGKSTVGAVLDWTALTNTHSKGGWWYSRPYRRPL